MGASTIFQKIVQWESTIHSVTEWIFYKHYTIISQHPYGPCIKNLMASVMLGYGHKTKETQIIILLYHLNYRN